MEKRSRTRHWPTMRTADLSPPLRAFFVPHPIGMVARIAAWRRAGRSYIAGVKGHLIIDLETLPDEGKTFAGELLPEVFDLPVEDAVPLGPLEFDLDIRRFGSELLFTGALSAAFEFTCVRTLEPFRQTIRLERAAFSLEIGNQSVIDATDALREEILLHFPAYPRCDEGDDPRPCEIDLRYLSVDKPGPDALPTPPRAVGDDRWSALDDLKDLKEQP